jgi:hypothetical protein
MTASAIIKAPRAPTSQADYLRYVITENGTGGYTPTLQDASGVALVYNDGQTASWTTIANNATIVECFPNEAGTNWVARLSAYQIQGLGTILLTTKTAAYVFALADGGTEVDYNSTSAANFTVNSGVFPSGMVTTISIRQIGTGAVTVVAGTGVTAATTANTSGGQNALITVSINGNTFYVDGNHA